MGNGLVFKTRLGEARETDSMEFMRERVSDKSVDLIITSPPFCLNTPKEYGNMTADNYLRWLREFAVEFHRILKESGSLVIDLGGAWQSGVPVRNLYQFKLLIMLCEECGFHLAQDFYWWNPSKLPTPAEWVTIRRIRVKDAINTIWWLSKSPFPKATNKRVLVPYSKHQLDLMSNGYKAKKRPSGHDISKSFQRDNRGSIPSNLIALPNTGSKDKYFKYCESRDIKPHPARFPVDIPAIFIRMLTEKGDTVFDPFAGSCTTGAAAEIFERSWVCCDTEKQYLEGAKGRFTKEALTAEKERILFGNGKRPRRPFYEAPAPCLNLIGEEDSPLPQDGGKHK